MRPVDFVLANTAPGPVPLVPEIVLRLADEPFGLWEQVGEALPYWAFAWAGGQALARYVLDHPDLVAGRRVLDLASGSGLVAVAAAMSGAAPVLATDVDPLAALAIEVNARANGVSVTVRCDDLLDTDGGDAEIVLAGDVCYDRAMADRVLPFLARVTDRGIPVLLGDPGRAHFPRTGFDPLASYPVPATAMLEAEDTTPTTVWRHRPRHDRA
ncbi:MAG TPA: 50S ribosomal protein L11 methyltransferase [Pseudonocardiaceae bacterium]|nr:50S ribosomal protein L11 methyltransferase [Pseudonocardiaceae bacterium]